MSPILRHRSDLTGSEVWEGDAREVAAAMPESSCSLAIFDGPYGMFKAPWDRMKVADLPEWYRPFLEDADRVLAPSASLYFWNTAEGWAAVHPVILSMGWTFRALVVWDKGSSKELIGASLMRTWPDQTEVCGFYQREEWAPSTCAGSEIAHAAGADEANPMPSFFRSERQRAGMTKRDLAAFFPSKTGGLTGCVANWEGGMNFPTWEVIQQAAAAMQETAPLSTTDRPYLVHPDFWRGDGDHLRATYDHLRAEYDHLRAEYEASRPAFTCPMGIGNVWTHLPVAGAERLRDADGNTLHACQKPIEWSERMIRASTRPGETVWAPFGGTLREAVAAERIARADPSEARRVITAELNQDGVDYIGPALRQLQGLGTQRVDPRQGQLFGGAR